MDGYRQYSRPVSDHKVRMIAADQFLKSSRDAGYNFFTGVPCTFLKPMINRVISSPDFDYVPATSEGEAIAVAAGAWLTGRKTVVMMQNSGLGNAVNPLTSLNFPFRIPTMLLITWRGGPGLKDEPQHELMGEITLNLLDVIRIAHAEFPKLEAAINAAVTKADDEMRISELPFAFVMQKGALVAEDPALLPRSPASLAGIYSIEMAHQARPTRYAVLERMLDLLPENAGVVATTGKTSRELYTIADRPQHMYLVGSMGGAAGMGMGVALGVDKPIVVVDGDGAALMKLGTLASIGAAAPTNLIHLVLDNASYDSTGGQPSVSEGVNFAAAAVACGYARGVALDSVSAFDSALIEALQNQGPHLIHVRIAPGSLSDLGRPTIAPSDVARRFRAFLA